MKPGTIIHKIISLIDSHAELMKNLLEELEESLDKENMKIKEEVGKKIANSFNLDIDQVLKKIIKKKKNIIIDQENEFSSQENDENPLEDKDFIPIYKKIIFEEKEYFYDEGIKDGIVLEKNGDQTKIVGYMGENNIIKFI